MGGRLHKWGHEYLLMGRGILNGNFVPPSDKEIFMANIFIHMLVKDISKIGLIERKSDLKRT